MNRKLFLLLCLCVFFYCFYENRPVSVNVRGKTPEQNFVIRMPYKDKKRLDSLFRHLCIVELWSYTLIGSKPVTFTGYRKPLFSSLSHPTYFVRNLRKFWRWETWLKYQHYFSDSRFQVFAESDPREGTYTWMTIIDTEHFARIVQQYQQDFRLVLGNEAVNPQAFIEEAKHRPFITDVLKDHDGLIGTILGYGRNNAWLFYDREQGKDTQLTSVWEPDFLDRMITHLSKKDWNLAPWELSDLYYPSFAAIQDSEETVQLKQIYQISREKIVRYYEGQDFVEATLSLFAGADPESQFKESESIFARE